MDERSLIEVLRPPVLLFCPAARATASASSASASASRAEVGSKLMPATPDAMSALRERDDAPDERVGDPLDELLPEVPIVVRQRLAVAAAGLDGLQRRRDRARRGRHRGRGGRDLRGRASGMGGVVEVVVVVGGWVVFIDSSFVLACGVLVFFVVVVFGLLVFMAVSSCVVGCDAWSFFVVEWWVMAWSWWFAWLPFFVVFIGSSFFRVERGAPRSASPSPTTMARRLGQRAAIPRTESGQNRARGAATSVKSSRLRRSRASHTEVTPTLARATSPGPKSRRLRRGERLPGRSHASRDAGNAPCAEVDVAVAPGPRRGTEASTPWGGSRAGLSTGTQIAARRVARGMTVKQCADRAGISDRTLRRYESGRRASARSTRSVAWRPCSAWNESIARPPRGPRPAGRRLALGRRAEPLRAAPGSREAARADAARDVRSALEARLPPPKAVSFEGALVRRPLTALRLQNVFTTYAVYEGERFAIEATVARQRGASRLEAKMLGSRGGAVGVPARPANHRRRRHPGDRAHDDGEGRPRAAERARRGEEGAARL